MTRSRWTAEPDNVGLRLDKFLADSTRLGSRGRVGDAIDRGKVLLNGTEVQRGQAGRPLAAGDVIEVWVDKPGSATRRLRVPEWGDLRIVYEDNALVVVDKPAGLLSVPLPQRGDAPSVFEHLAAQSRARGNRRGPFVVHRIDRDTSGLVVFAKSLQAQARLKDQFRHQTVERVYMAIVCGHPRPLAGTWRDRLAWHREALLQQRAHPRDPRGKEAVSVYRVIETLSNTSLVEVRLQTGKRNQIRIQAHLHGHPLVGERLYLSGATASASVSFPRQALHAQRLKFAHPDNGRVLEFESPMPADLVDLVGRLRRDGRIRRRGDA